jgi:hypothetical protein
MLRAIGLILLASSAATAEPPSGYAPPAADSVLINFNPGWRLMKGSHPLTVDDSAWEQVSTPHTYHEDVAFQDWKTTRDLGPFTYRKRFTIPAAYQGRRLLFEFQGIRQRGHFYLNGQLLGKHSNGVTQFGFDLTPHVKFGAENVLHVEIDCKGQEFGTNSRMCWFNPHFNPLFGGIHRNVILHVVPKVHATLPLYSSFGTEGTYVYAEEISTEKRTAKIGIEVQAHNAEAEPRQVTCQAVLVDLAGTAVATFDAPPARIEPGKNHVFVMSRQVGDLHFWQPGYPYLYDVYTIVQGGEGKPDVRKIVTGFRKIEVRGPELFLNNRVLMLHGYAPATQNEWAVVGSAFPDWMHDFSNALMAEGVSTIVRWMHCMAPPQDIASCDRVGLPQMVNAADYENDSQGREWELRTEIMRDAIVYARNNPSILLWEASNGGLSREHAAEMIALRDRWDPHGYRRPMGGRSGSPEWTAHMFGAKPNKVLHLDVEYMRDESPRRWWDEWSPPFLHPDKSEIKEIGKGAYDRNQDNMCRTQAAAYQRYYDVRPGQGKDQCCSGGAQIYFADTNTGLKRGKDAFRRSGPVDAMRVAKDAFFCNQTLRMNTPELWTEGRPSVFLPGHWNYPEGTVKPMYVFVSPGIERVKLLVNGVPVPNGKRDNTFQFTFPDVAFQPGRVEARGLDAAGKQVAVAAHETCGEPAAIRLKAIQGPGGLRADGSDLAMIETEVVDKQDRRCPLAQNLIRYQVSGPAVWRGGIWEENVAKYANKLELPVVNGVNRVIVRSRPQAGTVTVRAEADGLKSATLDIVSHPVRIEDGLTSEMPAVAPVVLRGPERYGPDLPPAPRPKLSGEWQKAFEELPGKGINGALIRSLTTAFPPGTTIQPKAANGAKIFADRDRVFAGLPARLVGAEYIQVANQGASIMAAEGLVFTLAQPGRVLVAYDEANANPPAVAGLVRFTKTTGHLMINRRPHAVYESEPMKAGDRMYLGTNNWLEQPPKGVNNMVVFVVPEGRQAPASP